MFKFIAALFGSIALMLVGVAPANAATTTITFDPSYVDATTGQTVRPPLPLAASAADWSRNTDVTAAVGECNGTRCVHFKVVDFACNRGAPVGGCAYRIPDGSCQVEVSQWVVNRVADNPNVYTDLLVTTHEAGHCIWSYMGIAQNFHLSDPRALMSASPPGGISPTLKQATLTSIDRRFTKSLL